MSREVIDLRIRNPKNIYHEIVLALEPYKEREVASVEFIVEGTKEEPIVGIRYPGRKVERRVLTVRRGNSAEWRNLFDFLVVPYIRGREVPTEEFTFEKILRDFEENKRDNEEFWKLIKNIYYENELREEPPQLPGIDSKLFLLVLKWMWIQEDFNYKLSWQDVGSPVKYVLETRTGSRTAKGAGRAKFFAALILLKHKYFTFEEVRKIIQMY